jgi:hypothetical protein
MKQSVDAESAREDEAAGDERRAPQGRPARRPREAAPASA